MANILSDEPAAFAADAEFVDKANGYIVTATDWNELLAACRLINSFFHGGSVPANLRIASVRVGATDGEANITGVDGETGEAGSAVYISGGTSEDAAGGPVGLFAGAPATGSDADGSNVFISASAGDGSGSNGITNLDAPGGATHVRIGHNGSGPTLGFFGADLVEQQAAGSVASDPTSTQALANALRTALLNLGLIS